MNALAFNNTNNTNPLTGGMMLHEKVKAAKANGAIARFKQLLQSSSKTNPTNPAKTQTIDTQSSEPLTKEQKKMRKAADELVAFSFILPMLKQIRNDPFRSELFHGGQGEEIWGSQLDQTLANRLSERLSLSIGKAVYEQFAQQAAAVEQAHQEVRISG